MRNAPCGVVTAGALPDGEWRVFSGRPESPEDAGNSSDTDDDIDSASVHDDLEPAGPKTSLPLSLEITTRSLDSPLQGVHLSLLYCTTTSMEQWAPTPPHKQCQITVITPWTQIEIHNRQSKCHTICWRCGNELRCAMMLCWFRSKISGCHRLLLWWGGVAKSKGFLTSWSFGDPETKIGVFGFGKLLSGEG